MKKMFNRLCYLNICLCCILFSCSSDSDSFKEDNAEIEINNESPIEKEVQIENSCKYENGTYPAIVYYSNSKTGYSQTYTIDVEVEDCQVIQINFPNGGHLDEDHISPGDIDENGKAYLSGENKNYEIHIQE